MSINSVNSNSSYAPVSQASSNQAEQASPKKEASPDLSPAAVYETSKASDSDKIDGLGINKKQLDKILEDGEKQRSESFRKLIENAVDSQCKKTYQASGGVSLKNYFQNLEVDEETRLQAQKEISDGGYYSVEKTSERILDFAKALAGNDATKFETLKDAVINGFKQAEDMWGDELPEISQKTYAAVMDGFDKWEKELNGETSAE